MFANLGYPNGGLYRNLGIYALLIPSLVVSSRESTVITDFLATPNQFFSDTMNVNYRSREGQWISE